MLRHLVPFALVAALGGGFTCTQQRASEPPPADARSGSAGSTAEAPASEAPASTAAAEVQCVDEWLARNDRDEYGSPKGTMYMGGTPLFDEASGTATDRLEYIYKNNPEVKALCRPEK